ILLRQQGLRLGAQAALAAHPVVAVLARGEDDEQWLLRLDRLLAGRGVVMTPRRCLAPLRRGRHSGQGDEQNRGVHARSPCVSGDTSGRKPTIPRRVPKEGGVVRPQLKAGKENIAQTLQLNSSALTCSSSTIR